MCKVGKWIHLWQNSWPNMSSSSWHGAKSFFGLRKTSQNKRRGLKNVAWWWSNAIRQWMTSRNRERDWPTSSHFELNWTNESENLLLDFTTHDDPFSILQAIQKHFCAQFPFYTSKASLKSLASLVKGKSPVACGMTKVFSLYSFPPWLKFLSL